MAGLTKRTANLLPFNAPIARYRVAQGLLVLITLLATLASFWYARSAEAAFISLQFDEISKDLFSSLELELETNFEEVYSLAAFFEANPDLSRDNFKVFTHNILARKPSILALEWVPKVPASERDAYEQRARADGWADFQFKQWQEDGSWITNDESWASFYYPVFYMEPLEGNEFAAGIDLGSNPSRRDALERAQDAGKSVATAPIILAQENAKKVGVLIFLPIYERGQLLDSVTARRRQLSGFALGVFQVDEIISAAIDGLAHEGLSLTVKDTTNGQTLLFEEREGAVRDTQIARTFYHDVGGRNWEFQLSASPGYVSTRRSFQPWIILFSGLALSILMFLFIKTLVARTHQVETLVKERTAELLDSKDKLEASTANLLESNQALERSNIELKQFAYIASHDLQTPLRTMGSFASLLEAKYSEQLDETARDYINRICDSSKYMQTLLHNLLDYSRIESQARPFEDVDLNLVVQDVVTQLKGSDEAFSPRITVDLLPTVRGDRVQLMQLYENLLGNALKYVENELPNVLISAKRNGSNWVLSVTDNGIGVAPRHQKQIFTMFKRLHTQETYPGTGIGLAICKRIVDRHGGQLWLESNIGEGSTFYVSLPA